MQDLPNGGGGRRSKHWPPVAGDPRYATGPHEIPGIFQTKCGPSVTH